MRRGGRGTRVVVIDGVRVVVVVVGAADGCDLRGCVDDEVVVIVVVVCVTSKCGHRGGNFPPRWPMRTS